MSIRSSNKEVTGEFKDSFGCSKGKYLWNGFKRNRGEKPEMVGKDKPLRNRMMAEKKSGTMESFFFLVLFCFKVGEQHIYILMRIIQ